MLVLDDDRDALALVREIIETTGATVTTADSETDALAKLDQQVADIIVADIGMPEMDGFELIKRIRNSDVVALERMRPARLRRSHGPKTGPEPSVADSATPGQAD